MQTLTRALVTPRGLSHYTVRKLKSKDDDISEIFLVITTTEREREKYKVLSAVPSNLLVRCFNETDSENIFRNTGHQGRVSLSIW